MGQWTIVVEGVGAHHNRAEHDADWMAREFVAKLKAKGHSITHASVTHSGREDITSTPAEPPKQE